MAEITPEDGLIVRLLKVVEAQRQVMEAAKALAEEISESEEFPVEQETA